MTYSLVDSLEALPQAVVDADCWHLDTEFMRERTFWAKLALVQIEAGGHIVLLDAPQLADAAALGQLMAPKRLVLHACSEDLDVLMHTTGVPLEHIEDTQLAAALAGHPLQLGYQRLVAATCGVDIPKDATRSNWLARPLSTRQLDYAADDVRYLEEARRRLVEKLESCGRMGWWKEECDRMLAQARQEVPAAARWRQVKGASLLQGREFARLQVLAAWRDQEARRSNRPRSFVIKDDKLLALCQQAPQNVEQLRRMGLSPGLFKRSAATLLQLLVDAEDQPLPIALPAPLDPEQKLVLKRLKQVVKQVASELQLEPEVLARRRWLESLLRHPDKLPEPLTGWRKPLLVERLLAAL